MKESEFQNEYIKYKLEAKDKNKTRINVRF
jgi:hypothetical protein